MAELFENAQVLNVRILNKVDTYANWMASEHILGDGEIAIARIPGTATETGLTPPAIGIRVGDGTKKFSDLTWAQATAGDVHGWAKKSTLEYSDLSEEFVAAIEGLVSETIQDTDTTYSFTYANDTLTVRSHAKGDAEGSEGTLVAELAIDVSTKINKVEGAVAGNVATMTADGQVADSAVALTALAKSADVAATYATQAALNAAIEGVEGAAETLAGRVTTAEGEIDALQAKDTELQNAIDTKVAKVTGVVDNVVLFAADGAIKDSEVAMSALAKSADVANTYATKQELNAAIEGVEGAAETLAGRVTTAEGEIDDLQAAVETLNGTGEGSVKATVDAAINKFATDISDDQTVNSFKELVDWVADHGEDAAEMAAGIKANADAIDVLEAASHEHSNKTVLDGISADKVTAWDGAVTGLAQELLDRAAADTTLQGNINAEAKARGDEDTRLAGLIGENAAAIDVLEAASHEHANKELLDDITAAQVTAWDAAVQSISGVETTKTGTDVAITGVSTDLLVKGTKTLVFNCGTASTVF